MAMTNVVSKPDSSNLAKWDFTRIRRLSDRSLRLISHQHSQCGKKIGVTLAGLFRCYVDFDIAEVGERGWGEVLNAIPAPCAVFMVKASSTEDPLLFEIDLKLAFAMIDRLLGGSGESVIEARELTSIEKRIISKPIQKIANLVASAWNEYLPMTLTVGELISNPELIEIPSIEDVAVAVRAMVRIGGIEGTINIFYPITLLNPILSTVERTSKPIKPPKPRKDAAEALLKQIRLPVYIRFAPSMVNVEHLIGLRKGDVLLLDSRVNDEVEVYVANSNLWMGRPGSVGGRIGVKLTRSVKGGK